MSADLEKLLRESRPAVPTPRPEATERAEALALAELPRARERAWRLRLPRVTRRPALALAAAAAAIAIGIGIGLAAGSSPSSAGVRLEGTLTPSLGVSVDLPAGWTGRIYNAQPASAPTSATVQLADLALPPDDDDTATKAAQQMGPDDVLIILLESTGSKTGFTYPPLAAPLRISDSDFLPAFEGVSDSHAFARRLFSTHGRRFMLWVQFGQKPAPSSVVARANRVLETMRFTALGHS